MAEGYTPRKYVPRKTSRAGEVTRKKRRDFLNSIKVHTPLEKAWTGLATKMENLKKDLRLSYAMVAEQFDEWRHLSPGQMRFAKEYAELDRSDIATAMLRAGFNYDRKDNAIRDGKQFLRLPGVEELVAAFEFERKCRMKLTVEDVAAWFQRIAEQAMANDDLANANRAMENLGKWLGMFVERKEVTHVMVHNRAELDARIIELTEILREAEPIIAERLQIDHQPDAA